MIKKLLSLIALGCLLVSISYAGEKACCAAGKATIAANDTKMQCISFANLNLTADQKTKLEAWSSECMQAGCTTESHAKFLREAKRILSADQYAALKKQCGSGKKSAGT